MTTLPERKHRALYWGCLGSVLLMLVIIATGLSLMRQREAHESFVRSLPTVVIDQVFADCADLLHKSKRAKQTEAMEGSDLKEAGKGIQRLGPSAVSVCPGNVYIALRGGFEEILAIEFVEAEGLYLIDHDKRLLLKASQ